jgi:hypothetical protein
MFCSVPLFRRPKSKAERGFANGFNSAVSAEATAQKHIRPARARAAQAMHAFDDNGPRPAGADRKITDYYYSQNCARASMKRAVLGEARLCEEHAPGDLFPASGV